MILPDDFPPILGSPPAVERLGHAPVYLHVLNQWDKQPIVIAAGRVYQTADVDARKRA